MCLGQVQCLTLSCTSDLAVLLVRLRATSLGPGHHTLSVIIAAATAAVGRLCLLRALCRPSCCACGWLCILRLSLPLPQHQTPSLRQILLTNEDTQQAVFKVRQQTGSADQPVLSAIKACNSCVLNVQVNSCKHSKGQTGACNLDLHIAGMRLPTLTLQMCR